MFFFTFQKSVILTRPVSKVNSSLPESTENFNPQIKKKGLNYCWASSLVFIFGYNDIVLWNHENLRHACENGCLLKLFFAPANDGTEHTILATVWDSKDFVEV